MIPARAAPRAGGKDNNSWQKPAIPGKGAAGPAIRPAAKAGTGAKVISAASSPASSAFKAKQEEMQKRQADLKARREQEEEKRAKQHAALVVKKTIQKLRVCAADKFQEVLAELEEVQAAQAEAMGDLVDEVSAEAAKAMEVAEKRFKEAEEKKAEEERKKEEAKKRAAEKKAEEERKAAEEQERLEGFVAEAEAACEEAEAEAAKAQEVGKALEDEDASPQDILDAANATEEALATSKPAVEKAVAFVKEKRTEVTKAKSKAGPELSKQLAEIAKKLVTSQKAMQSLQDSIKVKRAKTTKKVAAIKKEEKQKDAFKKAKPNKDGVLGAAQVVEFAKSEYSFELVDASKDKIIARLAISKGGVPYELFQQLRAMISIEKSVVSVRAARAEQEKIEKDREEKKAAITAQIEPINALFAEAEAALASAKKAVIGLSPTSPTAKQELTSSKIFEICKASQEQVDLCTEKIEAAEESQKAIINKEEDEADESLAKFRKGVLEKLTNRSKGVKTPLSKISTQVKEAKEKASRKMFIEMEKFRLLVVPCIMELMAADSTTGDSLHESAQTKEGFVALVKSLSEKLPADSLPEPLQKEKLDDDQAEKLFSHLAGDNTTVEKERFVFSMTRHFVKVVKPTVVSEDSTMSAKALRKLDLEETLEWLDAPKMLEAEKLKRVKCRALRDGKEGWVTLSGNKGSIFLEGIPQYFNCTKETPLTDGLSVLNSKSIRKTAKGELVQVLEFDTKDDSVNLMRIKVFTVRDEKIGWVTLASSEGTKFFEPC